MTNSKDDIIIWRFALNYVFHNEYQYMSKDKYKYQDSNRFHHFHKLENKPLQR